MEWAAGTGFLRLGKTAKRCDRLSEVAWHFDLFRAGENFPSVQPASGPTSFIGFLKGHTHRAPALRYAELSRAILVPTLVGPAATDGASTSSPCRASWVQIFAISRRASRCSSLGLIRPAEAFASERLIVIIRVCHGLTSHENRIDRDPKSFEYP